MKRWAWMLVLLVGCGSDKDGPVDVEGDEAGECADGADNDSNGDFDCDDCTYRSSCEFNGIGAARRLYRDFESRTGSCYGPREVDSVIAPQVAAE